MILSGILTSKKPNQPYVYDYVKEWTNHKTFFITSQSMKVSTIDLVYNSPSLDTFICQENSGYDRHNDMGANDFEIATVVENILSNNVKRFFAIIQFNNTHYPYGVADKRFEQFQPSKNASLNAYDNAILEQDNILQNYFDFLESKSVIDSTIIIFTSDHGEAFEQHGHSGHLQTLYNEDCAVPFWIYLPPTYPTKQRKELIANSTTLTSHVDIFPTMMGMLNIYDTSAINVSMTGASLLRKKDTTHTVFLFGEELFNTQGIITSKYKYLFSKKDNRFIDELYEREKDPREENNIWSTLSQKEREYLKKVFHREQEKREAFNALK
jgi:glucan phosphoethanolaminetransferase (alkaline phosphatase superfamily)